MDPETEIIELKTRIGKLEWVLVGFALSVMALLSMFCLFATMLVPWLENIFSEMLGGMPLPGITQLVINLNRGGVLPLIVVLIPIGAAISLMIKRRNFAAWVAAFVAILLLIVMTFGIVVSMFVPWLSITTELSA